MRVALALTALVAGFALATPPAFAEFGYVTQWGSGGSGDGQFGNGISGMEVDPTTGDVLVADSANQRVQRFTNAGAYLRQWATAGNAGIGINSAGTVYVGNLLPTAPEVDTYDSVGSFLGTFKTFPENIHDTYVDRQGNVIVITGTGVPGEVVKKFDASGTLVAQWGSYTSNDGNFSPSGTTRAAADSQGNVYITDSVLNWVQKFSPTGTLITKWGTPGSGNGQFQSVVGITVDAQDNVWVADALNGRIQKFDSNGGFLLAFGTPGRSDSQFDRPSDVVTDSAGNVYVMDEGNGRVVKLGERPEPVVGKVMGAEPVSGTVLVRLPGTKVFVTLSQGLPLPVGTIVDARKGRVRIRAIAGGKKIEGDFFEGQFQIAQRKGGATADIKLFGGAFKRCPAGLRSPRSLGSKKPKSVRHLWGEGAGAFRTVGRFSAATVRGTTWLTDDQCTGTLTRVTNGSVAVRDFVKRKTVLVKAGARYFARARGR